MTRDDLANQVGFLIVELRPSGAQQNGFPTQAEGKDLADQRMGMQNGLRIIGVSAGVSRNQPGKMTVQRGDHLVMY